MNGGIDFLGAAPDADIVVVKLKQAKQFLRDYYMTPPGVPAYGTNDIMLAVKYLSSFCIPFHIRAVICLGVGSSFGIIPETPRCPSTFPPLGHRLTRWWWWQEAMKVILPIISADILMVPVLSMWRYG